MLMSTKPFWKGQIAGVSFLTFLYILLGILVILPLGFIVISAFTTEAPRPGNIRFDELTLENFETAIGNDSLQATGNSLIVGIGATALALVIGAIFAFLLTRTDIP